MILPKKRFHFHGTISLRTVIKADSLGNTLYYLSLIIKIVNLDLDTVEKCINGLSLCNGQLNENHFKYSYYRGYIVIQFHLKIYDQLQLSNERSMRGFALTSTGMKNISSFHLGNLPDF